MKILRKACCLFFICQLLTASNSNGQSPSLQNASLRSENSSADGSPVFNIPDPVGFVSDFENLFSKSEIQTLDSMIMDFNKKSSIQIVVLTIDTLMIQANQMNDFSRQTFKSWGLQATGSQNGILISLSRAYRNIRIETGSGVEQVLSDADKKKIIQTAFIPSLSDSKYYKATYDGLAAIINKLKL